MQILHISNDFSNTKVHSNLFKRLDKLGIRQTIFNPIIISRRDTIGCNEFSANQASFIYADIVKPYHRYVYHIKRRDIFQALEEMVDLKAIDLVNATTLFSDGGQAYKIHKNYGIPYIVSVRNTDINGFLDKLPNTWVAGYRILSDAKKESERIIQEAEAKSRELIDRHEITRNAQQSADEILSKANEEAEKMRNAASSYIENIMKKADDELSEQLAMLKKARQSFMTLQSKNQQKRTSKK